MSMTNAEHERMLKELCEMVKKQGNVISELKKEVGQLRNRLEETYHKVALIYSVTGASAAWYEVDD